MPRLKRALLESALLKSPALKSFALCTSLVYGPGKTRAMCPSKRQRTTYGGAPSDAVKTDDQAFARPVRIPR